MMLVMLSFVAVFVMVVLDNDIEEVVIVVVDMMGMVDDV